MLSGIFSPVWFSVMSYIIFLRKRKTKKHSVHISFIVFMSCFNGFFYPLFTGFLNDKDIHFSLATSLVSSLVAIILNMIIFLLVILNRRSYERN